MTLSPLQLHRYYAEEIFCKANPDFDKDKEVKIKDFQVLFETGEDKNPLLRRIRLTIEQTLSNDGNEPFAFKIVMVGFFEVMKEFFESQGTEKTEQLVNVNGPALLYSAARELLALVSGRGPYTDENLNVLLPSITFLNFKPMKPAKEPKQTKTKKK
jgi:preprotein translocase subunit SecB